MSEMFRGGFTAVVVIVFMVIVNIYLFSRARRRRHATDDINSVRDFHEKFGVRDSNPGYVVKSDDDDPDAEHHSDPAVISSARAMNDQYTYHYLRKRSR